MFHATLTSVPRASWGLDPPEFHRPVTYQTRGASVEADVPAAQRTRCVEGPRSAGPSTAHLSLPSSPSSRVPAGQTGGKAATRA